jgi:ubiquinone biosynthesis accessory factor UbiJ
MFESLRTLFQDATQARVLLLLNHVLVSEPVGAARLAPWAGRTIGLELADLPAPLRALPIDPVWCLRVTAAGLLEEASTSADELDLRIHVDAANPLRMALQAISGERPSVRVEGDAALAADIGWLIQNLRWDLEDDLSKLIGPLAAHQLAQFGRSAAAALARLASTVGDAAASLGSARGWASGGQGGQGSGAGVGSDTAGLGPTPR